MRQGVTLQEVFEAAETLQAQGANPTIDRVRDFLGSTGSNSTISKHLNHWRKERAGKENKPISPPDRVQAAVDSVWQQIREQTNVEIDQIKEEARQQVESAQKEAIDLLDEKQKLQQEYLALQQSYYSVSAEKEILTLDLNKLREEHNLLIERHNGLDARLAEMQSQSTHQLAFASDTHQKEISRLQRMFEELKKAHQTLVDEIKAQAEQERHRQMMAIENLKTDKQKQEKRINELQVKMQNDNHRITELSSELTAAIKERDIARNYLAGQEEKWQLLNDKMLMSNECVQKLARISEVERMLDQSSKHFIEQMNLKFTKLHGEFEQLNTKLEMQDA